jgi:hypothetical protein
MAGAEQKIAFTDALVVGGQTPVPPPGHWRLTQNKIYALSVISVTDYGVNMTVVPRRFDPGGLAPDRAPLPTAPLKTAAEEFLNGGIFPTEVSFVFGVNPSNLTQDAPPAIYMQPTMGGIFTDHRGQPFANISISGTTGLRPNPKSSTTSVLGVSVPSLLGGAVAINPDTGLPVGEETGFDALVKLKKLFQAYAKMRSDPKTGAQTHLLWTNAKMGEAFIVEPVGAGLTIVRDRSSPLTASYSISLRVVDSIDGLLVRSLVQANGGAIGFFEKLARFSQDLRKAVNFFASVTDRVRGIAQAAISSFISVVQGVSDGIANMLAAGARIIAMPRSLIAQAVQSVTTVANALDSLTSQIGAYRQFGLATGIAELKNACVNAARSLAGVATERKMFRISADTSMRRGGNVYAPRSALAPTPASADVPNQRAPSGAGRVLVRQNDTLRSIALRYMGNAAMWQTIARMNNLSPPFIDPNGDGYSVLRPGDQILVPTGASDSGDAATISPATQGAPFVAGRDLDDVLGVDAKLISTDGAGTLESFDLDLDSTGDVARVRGQDNMHQAIRMKFATEKGELPLNPLYGAGLSVGTSIRNTTLGALIFSARATLVQDDRVTGIDALNVQIDGSTIAYSGHVRLRDNGGTLTLNQVVTR